MRYLLTSLLCVLTLSLTAQVDCPNVFDYDNDGNVSVNDFLAMLSVFGDTDIDSDGIWDSLDVFCNQGLSICGITTGSAYYYISNSCVVVYITANGSEGATIRLPDNANVGHTIHFLMDRPGNATCCASGNQCGTPQFQENISGSWVGVGSINPCNDYVGTIPGARATLYESGWSIN